MKINWSPKYIPGDFVYDHNDEVIRITSSYLQGTRLFWYSEGSSGWIREDAIKPIPLTPEILEKNGWKAVDGKRLNYSSYEKVFISRERRPNIFMQNGKFYHDLFGKNRIDFVHQLQHLLFGLDLDSNIKL